MSDWPANRLTDRRTHRQTDGRTNWNKNCTSYTFSTSFWYIKHSLWVCIEGATVWHLTSSVIARHPASKQRVIELWKTTQTCQKSSQVCFTCLKLIISLYVSDWLVNYSNMAYGVTVLDLCPLRTNQYTNQLAYSEHVYCEQYNNNNNNNKGFISRGHSFDNPFLPSSIIYVIHTCACS